MVEWYPGEAMKDFVYILDTMHETSKRIFEKKKRALYGRDEAALNESEREEGDLGPLMQGKDIMSILRKLLLHQPVHCIFRPTFTLC